MDLTTIEQANEKIQGEFSIILAITHTCSVCTVTKRQLDTVLEGTGLTYDVVYIDDVPEFRGNHLVWAVPTVLIFSGGREYLRESRFINMTNIKNLIDRFLN